MLCVLIRIASSRRFYWVHWTYNHSIKIETIFQNYRYLLPELVSWLTRSGSNNLCLERISMVPKINVAMKIRTSSKKASEDYLTVNKCVKWKY